MPEASSPSSEKEAMFSIWKGLRQLEYRNMPDYEAEQLCDVYRMMAERIINMKAENEREFAMQYCVATDDGDSIPGDSFNEKMASLVRN